MAARVNQKLFQVNQYLFDITNPTASCPVKNVLINTCGGIVVKNRMVLEIKSNFWTDDSVERIESYIATRFLHFSWALTRLEPDSTPGKASLVITIADYNDARGVINTLFAHGEMTPTEREGIETKLRELEKNGDHATKLGEPTHKTKKRAFSLFKT